MDLIKLCGNFTKITFRTDFIKENRHQFTELFGQIVDGLNGMIEQAGDVTLEKISIFYTGTGEFNIDNKG